MYVHLTPLRIARSITTGLALGLALLFALGVHPASAATLPIARSVTGSDVGSPWLQSWVAYEATSAAENAGYWKPILKTKFRDASVSVELPNWHTASPGCDLTNLRAMYCLKDHVIYVDGLFLAQQERLYGAHAAQLIVAHEYGHHVQSLQGLPYRGEYSELQADCLAGAALSSQSVAEKLNYDTLVTTVLNTSNAAGDPSTTDYSHGTGNQRVHAVADGWNDLSNCGLTNTTGFYWPSNLA